MAIEPVPRTVYALPDPRTTARVRSRGSSARTSALDPVEVEEALFDVTGAMVDVLVRTELHGVRRPRSRVNPRGMANGTRLSREESPSELANRGDGALLLEG